MKIKSYSEVTEQLNRIGTFEFLTEELKNEEYIYLSWEDWAFCLTQLDYYPQVIACSEEGYTVLADSLNRRLDGFKKDFN